MSSHVCCFFAAPCRWYCPNNVNATASNSVGWPNQKLKNWGGTNTHRQRSLSQSLFQVGEDVQGVKYIVLLLGVVMEKLVVIIVGMKRKHLHKHTTYQHDHHGKAKKLAITQTSHPPEMSHWDWWNSTLKRKAFQILPPCRHSLPYAMNRSCSFGTLDVGLPQTLGTKPSKFERGNPKCMLRLALVFCWFWTFLSGWGPTCPWSQASMLGFTLSRGSIHPGELCN